ncbi:Holliday junction resolvase RuvX [uncultured Umboniibacter sp.]|uniref:Holliday junction resolvase RuvX n=1 Tax=uncultured Umboniibacter sp. TaxID=1798917 RepID=UPI002625F8D4|nr:Holliday junction resolvase RuvX [uncultured Umboniibacter sp.]
MSNQLVLAFDFGMRSIGCAVGQTISGTASELKPLSAVNGAPHWAEMEALINEWQPHTLIVGLPLNMDGSESEMCQSARRFGNRLNGRFKLPVEMADERLTTREAKHEAHLRGRRGSYKTNPVDSIAARMILEGWLSKQH